MKKELLWAGIIGISFGLIIGFGVWRVKSSISTSPNTTKIVPQATPKEVVVGQLKLSIATPIDYGVISDSSVTVSGITKASTWVVVSSGENDYISKSNDDGTFSANINLDQGINTILATSVSQNGNSTTEKVTAVYSSSFKIDTSSDNATDEAQIDKTVSLKLSQAQNPPKAYIGTVTDIADSTIQIKNMSSQIQQIETNKFDITAVNTKGTSNKNIKLTDIAIGDFIIAMGYIDGNEVLDAQRILVTNVPDETKENISFAKIAGVSKKTFTISDGTVFTPDKNTNLQIYTGSNSKKASISDFKPSDNVIIITNNSGTPALLQTVFDIGQ